MRKTVLLCVALFVGLGCSEPTLKQDLLYNGEVYSRKDSAKPFTGTAVETHPNGEPKWEGTFKKGLLERTVQWYENGETQREEQYKKGKLHGLQQEWYPDGHRKKEENYSNGTLQGVYIEYDENEFKIKEEQYNNGNIWTGVVKEHHLGGEIRSESTLHNGKIHGKRTLWRENGKKEKEETYQHGKLHGTTVHYDQDGTAYELQYKDGLPWDGTLLTTYESGPKKQAESFEEGIREGLSTFWRESGKREREERYARGQLIEVKRWNYAETKLIEHKKWTPSGQRIK